jgi:general secretion pathway protein B
MSYILEGLKKLEQKRRQETKKPGFLSFRGEIIRRPERAMKWPYLLFIALLLNAGIIVWWMAPWRSSRPQPLAQKQLLPGPPAKAVTPKPVEFKNQNPLLARKEPASSKVVNKLPRKPAAEKPKESALPLEQKKPAPKKPPETESGPPESKSSFAIKTISDGPVVKLNALPSEIKKDLPVLKMSVHYYSPDKQSRFVTINNRTLHEGETLSEGLRLVEINSEGAILFYKGYRFLVSVNENL